MQVLFVLTTLVFGFCLYVTMSSIKEKIPNRKEEELLSESFGASFFSTYLNVKFWVSVIRVADIIISEWF